MADSDRDSGAEATGGSKDLRAAVTAVARPETPFKMGDFELDDEGRLRPRPDGAPIAFGFSFRGIDFIARVDTGAPARVGLSAELGKLPFRAESGERRQLTRRIVSATERLARGRISLNEAQDLHLEAEAAAPSPLTPVGVMAALAAILLEFKPYLELLHDVMIAPLDAAPIDPSAPQISAQER